MRFLVPESFLRSPIGIPMRHMLDFPADLEDLQHSFDLLLWNVIKEISQDLSPLYRPVGGDVVENIIHSGGVGVLTDVRHSSR